MISLTIGLILLAGITTLIVRQSTTRAELDKSSRQIENGRYAIQILSDDIEHAGLYGEYSPLNTITFNVPSDPCDTTIANLGWNSATPAIPVPVYGYTGTDATPSCITNRKSGTAILVVRRTDTSTAATPDGASAYLQVSRCNTDISPFALGTSGFTLRQKDCVASAPLRKYIVRIYYISSCSNCGTGADSIPTLKMVEFASGAQTTIPLVEGIENMQFDYGVDTTNDGSPDSYTTSPTSAQWDDVMAIRVSLLARNTEPTGGYADTKSYTLGSVAIAAANDSYKRHVYSQLTRVVNASGRREH
ncbi:MAG: PilW family protein [Gallionellaceae bacterium]|nr:PilW family protein [Gallionellaceae bacterium]